MPAAARIDNYFVCVGAQKAGTSWLMRQLARHPDIFVTPVKEIHYFDHVAGLSEQLADAKCRSRRRKYLQRLAFDWSRGDEYRRQWSWYRTYGRRPIDDLWYARLFEARAGKRFAGEASPEYALIGTAGFAHLAALAPDARVLYLLRHPGKQMWSQILHHCRRERVDAGRLGIEAIIALAETPRRRALADFGATIDALRTVFAPDRLKLAFYEDIHADRAAALAEFVGFLGADPARQPAAQVEEAINRSQPVTPSEAARARLVALLRPVALGVAERLGRVPASWRDDFGL